MAKISDVSAAAGVSTATVSRALRNPDKVSAKTLKKVMQAVEALNYRPNSLARNLRQDQSFLILVLVPGIANLFFAQVLQGVERAAKELGYSIVLGDTREDIQIEEDYFRLLETRVVDGVLHLSPNPLSSQKYLEKGYPIVHANGSATTPAPSVRIDNEQAAHSAVEHLIKLGHKSIACISGNIEHPHARERLSGYRKALESANIKVNEDLIYYGDFSMQSGVDIAQTLMNRDKRPSALFCMKDEIAIGAMQSLQAKGFKLPNDIAIAGFDNIDFATSCSPALTTVSQPAETMGDIALRMLIKAITKKPIENELVVLPHQLHVRASSGSIASY